MNWLTYILISFIFVYGCNESRNKDSAGDRQFVLRDFKHKVVNFKDSIDQLLPTSTVQKSLIFSKHKYSFYAVRHLIDRNIHLYKEIAIEGNSNFIEKRFYLGKGKLVLYELYERNSYDTTPKRTSRVYFRKGKLVGIETSSTDAVKSEELFSSNGDDSREILKDLNKLRDAIYQKGDFDLVYDSFAHYPNARYIILSNSQINPYRAAIRIEKPDDFMKMILSNPEKYKGRKLNLKWRLREPFEALYSEGGLD